MLTSWRDQIHRADRSREHGVFVRRGEWGLSKGAFYQRRVGILHFRALLHWAMIVVEGDSGGMRRSAVRPVSDVRCSACKGFRLLPEVIVLAVRWYLRLARSDRDVEARLAERGIEVEHVTVFGRVPRVTPLVVDAARPCRHRVGDRWEVDET
jgi:hypothetical protein